MCATFTCPGIHPALVSPGLNCINLQRANVPTVAYLLKDKAVLSGELWTIVGLEKSIFPSHCTGNPSAAVKAILQWRHTVRVSCSILDDLGDQIISPVVLGRWAGRFDEAGVLRGLDWHVCRVVDSIWLNKLFLLTERYYMQIISVFMWQIQNA